VNGELLNIGKKCFWHFPAFA